MVNELPRDLATAVALGGQMGRRFAEFDWAAHPLGPVHTWPEEVRGVVAVALTSRFPIVLWLGAEHLWLVYNDAYIAALEEMFEKTDTDYAPWTIIEGNWKWWARIKALKTVVHQIEEKL